jgi:PTH1 family peptidyl-tRNA hydrolase
MQLFRKKESMEPIKTSAFLIIGLGNPGREFKESRHNIGFMIVDRIAEMMEIRLKKVQSKAIISTMKIDGKPIILVKPHTFMNQSGNAVASLAKYYKVSVENILIIHDDIDLPLGTIRIRKDGGSAGQKGVASIIERLGTESFPRMRLGVGRPAGKKQAATYVLEKFLPQEKDILEITMKKGVEAVKLFIEKGIEAAMTHFNGTV